MIELERIEDLCDRLALGTMATQFSHFAERTAREGLSFQEFFERLLQAEYHQRQERTRAFLTRMAGFPSIKTLKQYDLDFRHRERQSRSSRHRRFSSTAATIV
jgi:hypothetical protein